MFRNLFKKVNPAVAPENAPERKNETQDLAEERADSMTRAVKLGIEKNLFKRTGDAAPIVTVRTGTTFQNLQVRGKLFESNEVILENSASGQAVAIVERHYATIGNVFKIYSAHPAYSGQTSTDLPHHNEQMYAFADVSHHGKVLTVIEEGQTAPTYSIHHIMTLSDSDARFGTKYVIKKNGTEVASTRYGQGNSFIPTVSADDVDPCLMICLAVVSDEVDL